MKYTLTIIAFLLLLKPLAGQDLASWQLQYNQATADSAKLRLARQIGYLYEERLAYQKSAHYYKLAAIAANKIGQSQAEASMYANMGRAQEGIAAYTEAIVSYRKALALDPTLNGALLPKLTKIAHLAGNLPEAIASAEKEAVFHAQQGNKALEAKALCNLGLLLRQSKQAEASAKALEKSMAIYEQLTANKSSVSEALILSNAGITAAYLADFEHAQAYFERALAISQNTPEENARLMNMLASNSYLRRKYEAALQQAEEAMAMAPNDKQVQQEALQLKAMVFQKLEQYKEAQEATNAYNALKADVAKEEQLQREALTKAAFDAEKFDADVKLLAAEREKQIVESVKLSLELEKQEKDIELQKQALAIAQQNEALQQQQLKAQELEKQQIAQQLALAQQQAAAAEQAKAIAVLEQNKKLQDFALAKQQAEQEEQAKELLLLAKEKELGDRALEDAASKRKFTTLIIFLILLMFIGAVVAWYRSRSTARQLAFLNKEIEAQHEELKQTNEELQSSEEELRQNSEELLAVNERLSEEKKHTEDALLALQSTQKKLVQSEKMASLGQLTAGVAHEINNPVNYISGGTQALSMLINDLSEMLMAYATLEKVDDPERKEIVLQELKAIKKNIGAPEEITADANAMINDIQKGADRVAEIVRGLRNFSRGDEDEVKIASIHELLDTALVILRNKYKGRIDIQQNYGAEVKPVKCYPGPLSQVFMNIIANAIDAIPQKGSITLTTMVANKHVEIRISDTGSGMPQHVIDRIFDPFFTTKDVGKGTGLGLSIVHGIIERHNGRIEVYSEQGQGTTFVISLPNEV